MKAATSTSPNTAVSGRVAWFPLVFSAASGILSIGKDVFFSLLARRKLYSQFREMAVRAVAPNHIALPMPPPRPPAAPPKIPAQS